MCTGDLKGQVGVGGDQWPGCEHQAVPVAGSVVTVVPVQALESDTWPHNLTPVSVSRCSNKYP